ncbi:hypothetical protein L596_030242 [Steinernema carpocapsae]|uniref:Uncharacterized protein n=1 Tax=Steinernema carpocapsae TaxID=34508 RepID=A0A4U5LS60_STECR|nr:hypothetical protein L596_030242 [Steinernema carpocapsae]
MAFDAWRFISTASTVITSLNEPGEIGCFRCRPTVSTSEAVVCVYSCRCTLDTELSWDAVGRTEGKFSGKEGN